MPWNKQGLIQDTKKKYIILDVLEQGVGDLWYQIVDPLKQGEGEKF